MKRSKLFYIYLTIYYGVLPSINGIFIPEFFRGWMNDVSGTGSSCEGSCQLSLTCWISGGRQDTPGDCQSMFKVSFQLGDCCNNSFLHAFTTVWWILYELTLVVVGKVGSSKMQYKVLNSWVNECGSLIQNLNYTVVLLSCFKVHQI